MEYRGSVHSVYIFIRGKTLCSCQSHKVSVVNGNAFKSEPRRCKCPRVIRNIGMKQCLNILNGNNGTFFSKETSSSATNKKRSNSCDRQDSVVPNLRQKRKKREGINLPRRHNKPKRSLGKRFLFHRLFSTCCNEPKSIERRNIVSVSRILLCGISRSTVCYFRVCV